MGRCCFSQAVSCLGQQKVAISFPIWHEIPFFPSSSHFLSLPLYPSAELFFLHGNTSLGSQHHASGCIWESLCHNAPKVGWYTDALQQGLLLHTKAPLLTNFSSAVRPSSATTCPQLHPFTYCCSYSLSERVVKAKNAQTQLALVVENPAEFHQERQKVSRGRRCPWALWYRKHVMRVQ